MVDAEDLLEAVLGEAPRGRMKPRAVDEHVDARMGRENLGCRGADLVQVEEVGDDDVREDAAGRGDGGADRLGLGAIPADHGKETSRPIRRE